MSFVIRLKQFYTKHPIETWFFFLIHGTVFVALFFQFSWTYIYWMIGSYYLRMFFITGFLHRYFSHRTFRTSRWFQFVMAFLASMSAQRGVLWWASHHRYHHGHADQDTDIHSPSKHGFLWAHIGWIVSAEYRKTRWDQIRELAVFPELRWLDKNYLLPFLVYAFAWYFFAGWMGLLWGAGIGTILLYHGTFTVNSITHLFGKRRFETKDTSKNSFWIALITMGEGWHNNHHYYSASTRNGFYWWEIDLTFYLLTMLSYTGLIWELNPVPAFVYQKK